MSQSPLFPLAPIVRKRLIVLSIVLAGGLLSFAQKKTIELLHARDMFFDQSSTIKAKRLVGDVAFKDGTTIMYCDSAHLFDNTVVDAYGHVHIVKPDSINAYGELLHYDGSTKIAELNKNVKLIDKEMTIVTNTLFFNTRTNLANYTGGGTIMSKDNTLTSDKGYYFTHTKEVAFKKNVVMVNPSYTMYSDTLAYNTKTKITHFLGPTTIKSKQDYIYCEDGFYNTQTDYAQFYKNAYIITKKQKLKGDSIYYDKKNRTGRGYSNVSITDTSQNIVITGDYCYTSEARNLALVTGHAVLMQMNKKDTLFMHADTLRAENESKEDLARRLEEGKAKIAKAPKAARKAMLAKLEVNKDSVYKVLKAFHKVKFFKSDMQGKCDSLVYSYRDSTMNLYQDPVLWSQKNQLMAEHIEIITNKGVLQSMELTNSSFIISQDDTSRFNQIKGKIMHGYFVNNELNKIRVDGNGQSIYYGREKKKYIGVNKVDCSDMLVYLKENQVNRITFITKPDATMYPIKELKPEELKLKDFSWRIAQKPKSKYDIF
jgi:lipopolysaccharide export system protein LptA